MKPLAVLALCFALAAVMAVAATPQQEQALMSVWNVHTQSVSDHAAVLAACQKVMDKSSTLGEYLPVVKTIAAWHLLASGKEADAVRVFESALVSEQQPLSIAKFADIMARRWLTRLDIRAVDSALKTYYVEHVEYPTSLSPIFSLPKPIAPVKTDRFGDAWNYRLAEFSRLTKVKAQRYHLYSKSIGNGLSRLSDVSTTEYSPRKSAVLLARKNDRPVTVDLEIKIDGEAKRGTVIENNIGNGVRLLKLSSDQRFAVLTDSECDYWIIAVKSR